MIIVDTGFWLALANEQDHHHQQAQLVIQRLREPLITTWCVVTETCYLLLTRLGNHAQLLFIQNFLAGGFEVFELNSFEQLNLFSENKTLFGFHKIKSNDYV